MSENRIFYKKDGSLGMFATDDRVKFLRPFLHLFHCGIGKEIKHKHGSIDRSYKFRNLQIEQSITAKT